MKKIFRTLVAASVLLGLSTFTGCSFLMEHKLKNTEGKWFKYEGEVPNIPIGNNTAEEGDDTGILKDAELYFYFDRDDGLTVAVQAESTQKIELFNGAAVTNVDLTTGRVNIYEDFSTARWISLTEIAPMTACEEPKVSADPEHCVLIGGENANDIKIQWKKVLANIILNKLLGE